MKDYEVTIRSNSVSVKTKEFKEMIDPDTNNRVRIPVSTHRKALGLGDFKGDVQKYKHAVKEMLEEPYGKTFSELIAVRASLEQQLDTVLIELDTDRKIRQETQQELLKLATVHEALKLKNAALEKELEALSESFSIEQDAVKSLAQSLSTERNKNAALEKQITIMENIQR